MKLAYRIITPILAIGAVVMGLMLKLFYFAVGGITDEISSIVLLAEQFGVQTKYEFSAIEIIKMLMGADLGGNTVVEEGAEAAQAGFMTIAEPILPQLIAFVIFFVIALLLFLATGVVAVGVVFSVVGISALMLMSPALTSPPFTSPIFTFTLHAESSNTQTRTNATNEIKRFVILNYLSRVSYTEGVTA